MLSSYKAHKDCNSPSQTLTTTYWFERLTFCFRVCFGGGGPQVGEVTRMCI